MRRVMGGVNGAGDTIRRLLARRGYRLTGPRLAVVEVLARARAPLTVAAIHVTAGAGRPNLVSVYRAVNLLHQIGLLRVTDGSRSRHSARYELTEQFTGHHHHLICEECGRIEDLEGCLIPDAALARVRQRVRRARGFRVSQHELRLFGLCRDCRS